MKFSGWRNSWLLPVLMVLAACSSRPPAPVVERSSGPPQAEIPVDGLHRVHRGDTLAGIAFKYGLDYRDIAKWNGIRSPYTIYPDQVIRLNAPPKSVARTTPAPRPSSRTSSVPSPARPSASTPSSSKPAPPQPAPATPRPPPAKASPSSAGGGWIWPVNGRVLSSFKSGDPSRNGLNIASTEGGAVVAVNDGEVVYSGNGLIGYGELVIVRHDERMLSAYAHNRRRLVSEGEKIRRGQKIAEVGRNDRNEAMLHFEIRRDGKPVDPLNYLPRR